MPRSLLRVVALLAGSSFATSAYAADIGEDTASVNITINIPPFAAAIAAEAEGAVGLWTVSTSSSPLMVKLPSEVSEGQVSEGAIFASQGVMLDVRADKGSPIQVERTTVTANNGLLRQGLSLRSVSQNVAMPLLSSTATLTVSVI